MFNVRSIYFSKEESARFSSASAKPFWPKVFALSSYTSFSYRLKCPFHCTPLFPFIIYIFFLSTLMLPFIVHLFSLSLYTSFSYRLKCPSSLHYLVPLLLFSSFHIPLCVKFPSFTSTFFSSFFAHLLIIKFSSFNTLFFFPFSYLLQHKISLLPFPPFPHPFR